MQINSLFCKPICKPDAARQLETGETEPTERDGICPVRRGHRARQRRPETAETRRRMAHNPEVAGSNPAPATSFRRSGPFPVRERAFCVPGTVVKRVVGAGLRAARQRDGGDGVTRDETAWTWWTLPPAIAGRLAQRYHRCIARLFPFGRQQLEGAEPGVMPGPVPRAARTTLFAPHVHSAARTQLHGSSNPSRDYPHLVRTFTGRDHLPDVMTNQPYRVDLRAFVCSHGAHWPQRHAVVGGDECG